MVRSKFPSQKVRNMPFSEHFWKLRCRKSARRCGAKHISKPKVLKTEGCGPLLEVQMSFRVARARDCALCRKQAKRGVLSHFQKPWQAWGIWRGSGKMHFVWQAQYKRHVHQRSPKGLHFRLFLLCENAKSFRHQQVLQQHHRLLRLEHQILRFAEVILRDRCSTSYFLASLFLGRR